MKKSFSSHVKDELCALQIKTASEAASELAAMVIFGESNEQGTVTMRSDRIENAHRMQILTKKALGEEASIDIGGGRRIYSVSISTTDAQKIGIYLSDEGDIELDEDIYSSDECVRAFLRGAFISGGTIETPEKNYSCEMFTHNESMAYLAEELLADFQIKANVVQRKNYFVTYIKGGSAVEDFLNVIGAHQYMMEFIMTKIQKDWNNRLNRQANCSAANIDKTIQTSVKQCEAIEKLMGRPVWDTLSDSMKELALLRLEYKEEALALIGERMNPPLSKSAVSRRMKKLIELSGEE